MGLKNMSLSAAPTLTAGGDPVAFTDDGISIPNGVHLTTTDATYMSRKAITAKFRPATLDAKTTTLTKDKKTLSIACPMELGNGTIVFNVFRVEREVHPSTSVEDQQLLNNLAAGLILDADTANFWATGSMS
jgi:hypothetical protein